MPLHGKTTYHASADALKPDTLRVRGHKMLVGCLVEHSVSLLTLPFMKGLNPLLKSRQIIAAHFKRELAPSLNSF
ncbi:MAG: hypothetical protein AUK39_06265 [Dehalococcoidia bacterium CG2_30_46_19]|nr:MAG: hypothetical protein AUK39_06265 [Dehalococcoidia bacterium CG2_30_46_19]